MCQLVQGIAQKTIGQMVRRRVPCPPMFAIHVDHAKRTAAWIAKDHYRATSGTRRNDGDLSIGRWVDFETDWEQRVHPAQDASGIGQNKIDWLGIAFFRGFVRRCAKILQCLFQFLRKHRCNSVPSTVGACVEIKKHSHGMAAIRNSLDVCQAAVVAAGREQRGGTACRHDLQCQVVQRNRQVSRRRGTVPCGRVLSEHRRRPAQVLGLRQNRTGPDRPSSSRAWTTWSSLSSVGSPPLYLCECSLRRSSYPPPPPGASA